MTTWILKDKTIERFFHNFNYLGEYLFFLSKSLANFNCLDAIHLFHQKRRRKRMPIYIFSFFFNNFHIAIAQGFGLCIPTSHSEPLVTVVTVSVSDTRQ